MNLPPIAVKDHDFYPEDYGNTLFLYSFKCSKCNVWLVFPRAGNSYFRGLELPSKMVNQNFFYLYKGSSWDDVALINNLSCNELIIKNIIE